MFRFIKLSVYAPVFALLIGNMTDAIGAEHRISETQAHCSSIDTMKQIEVQEKIKSKFQEIYSAEKLLRNLLSTTVDALSEFVSAVKSHENQKDKVDILAYTTKGHRLTIGFMQLHFDYITAVSRTTDLAGMICRGKGEADIRLLEDGGMRKSFIDHSIAVMEDMRASSDYSKEFTKAAELDYLDKEVVERLLNSISGLLPKVFEHLDSIKEVIDDRENYINTLKNSQTKNQ